MLICECLVGERKDVLDYQIAFAWKVETRPVLQVLFLCVDKIGDVIIAYLGIGQALSLDFFLRSLDTEALCVRKCVIEGRLQFLGFQGACPVLGDAAVDQLAIPVDCYLDELVFGCAEHLFRGVIPQPLKICVDLQ